MPPELEAQQAPAAVRPGGPVAAASTGGGAGHALDLEQAPRLALAAVAGAAEAWGAEWHPGIDGGRLTLPTLAGIRRGLVTGRVRIDPLPAGGARVHFQPEETTYRLQTHAVAFLLLAALGGLLTVVWPFFPGLLVAAPLGAVIALSGWFLVVSRLQTSGPDDFLALVAEMAEAPSSSNSNPPSDT